jgi:hypothetical protein
VSGHHGGLHVCGGLDHHDGHYTPRQRADLDLVLAFNREASDVIDEGRDVLETLRFLDPDPLRYMWVDEGQGRIGEVVGRARGILARAPVLQGHRRAGRGDVVRAALDLPGAGPGEVAVLSEDVADVFRPTALIATDGVPWVFWGQSADGEVGVWAVRRGDAGWSAPHLVSTSEHPSFNQEVVAGAGGDVELVWQGREKERFGIFSRAWAEGSWGPATMVSAGVEANVWDPAVARFADGATAYAWSECCSSPATSRRVVTTRSTPPSRSRPTSSSGAPST